jgi:hypothetical protein
MRWYLADECSFAEQRRCRLREFFPFLGEPVTGDGDLDAWFSRRYLPLFEAARTCYPDVIPSLQVLAGQARPPRRPVPTNGDPRLRPVVGLSANPVHDLVCFSFCYFGELEHASWPRSHLPAPEGREDHAENLAGISAANRVA